MSKIRILADKVVNQIAAGEVIERPAAVVKELIENSLDAKATRIEVEFSYGGKRSIRIEDNGTGMTPDNALLCLERHATSKLQEVSDLQNIYSFGFRGEAIPSIASVSNFTLQTRSANCETGTEILINSGKIAYQKPVGMPQGTIISVDNLFNSVPVRRKFMKSDNTESAHILHLLRLYAVSNPQVAFRVVENGREVFKSLPTQRIKDRIRTIWSKKLVGDLIEIKAEDEHFKLQGLIGKPGTCRSTRAEMITLVNGRPVDSKTLNYALIESYHTYIPKGRYPIAFLFLEIEPSWVDVNVHPAKREVRFQQEGLIRHFIIQTVLEALQAESAPPQYQAPKATTPAIPQPEPQTSPEPVRPKPVIRESAPDPIPSKAPEPQVRPAPVVVEKPPMQEPQACPWRLIGRLKDKYGLFESSEGLITINIRAAHERVLYERISATFQERASITQQPLLFPTSIELDALKSAALQESLDLLQRGGLTVSEFGRNFYRIEAIPEWMEPSDAKEFVQETAALFVEEGSKRKNLDHITDKLAKLAVTRGSKVDAQMNDDALKTLIAELFSTKNPHTSPFGKRIYTEVRFHQLEQQLG